MAGRTLPAITFFMMHRNTKNDALHMEGIVHSEEITASYLITSNLRITIPLSVSAFRIYIPAGS